MRTMHRSVLGWCLASLWLWTGCGQNTDFTGDKYDAEDRRSGDADAEVAPPNDEVSPDPGEIPKDVPPDIVSSGDERFTSEIQTNEGQTVTIDNYLLPRSFPVTQRLENSDNPIKMHSVEQMLGAPQTALRTVIDRDAQQKTITRQPPLRTNQPHDVTADGKPVDIFVTVDDSESFTPASITRTKTAVSQIIAELHNTDWNLFLGGLEGSSGNYDRMKISKGSMTLSEAQAAADNALTDIFNEGSNGDERVMRSLNRLAYDYRGQDRNDAVHAYFVVTDAPNCKDRNNDESGACDRRSGRNDHHTYLVDHNNNVADYVRTHMSLFGAYYRQSNNAAVCGNADDIEAPLANETLKLNSQYAELAYLTQVNHVPGFSGNPDWVGNLCSTTESTGFITTWTAAIKNAAAKRFVLSTLPDTFSAPDTAMNLAVKQGASTLSGGDYAVRGTRVIVLDAVITGSVQAIFHKHNNFRRTDYNNVLRPRPEPGTVVMSWATGGPFTCDYADSFAGLTPDVKCRHWNDDFFVRDSEVLPVLAPGDSPVNITIDYYNQVQDITSFVVTATSPIYPDTVQFTMNPAAADMLVADATYAYDTSGKQMTITFMAPLPAGNYSIEYLEHAQTDNSVTVPSPSEGGPGALVCYALDQVDSVALNTQNALVVEPPEAEYPCAFDGANDKVKFSGRVPIGGNNKRELGIAYKGFIAPIGVFPLDYPPFENEVAVSLGMDLQNTDPLSEDSYLVADNQVVLSDPLQPGEAIIMEYLFRPPLHQCYPLSGHVLEGYEYHAWYGEPGEEERLGADDFSIEQLDGDDLICLRRNMLVHGNKLVAGYITAEVPVLD